MTDPRCRALDRTPVIAPRGSGGLRASPRRLLAAIFGTLLTWQKRAAERAHLARLDERMLRDMGITRAEAEREASLPFWRKS